MSDDPRPSARPDTGELHIDWTGVPRPDYAKARLAEQPPLSDTLHTRVTGFRVCTCRP